MDGICTIRRRRRLLLLAVSAFISQDLGPRFGTKTPPLLFLQRRQNRNIDVDSNIVPPTHNPIPPVLSKSMPIQAQY